MSRHDRKRSFRPGFKVAGPPCGGTGYLQQSGRGDSTRRMKAGSRSEAPSCEVTRRVARKRGFAVGGFPAKRVSSQIQRLSSASAPCRVETGTRQGPLPLQRIAGWPESTVEARLKQPAPPMVRANIERSPSMQDMIRTRPGRYWFLALALMALASLMVPRQALAKDSTIAIHIEGPDAAALRNVLLAVVPPGTTVAESDTFNVALTQHGQKLPIGKSLEGDNRDRVLGKVRDAVAAAGMDGALLARVVKEKTQRLVKLVYVSSSKTEAPRDGEVARVRRIMR